MYIFGITYSYIRIGFATLLNNKANNKVILLSNCSCSFRVCLPRKMLWIDETGMKEGWKRVYRCACLTKAVLSIDCLVD